MGFILAQVGAQRLIQAGLKYVKDNPDVLDDIFSYYTRDEVQYSYGESYIEKIKTWLGSNKFPVVQAWNIDSSNVPGISIRLSQESEDISKAAMGDFAYMGDNGEIGAGVSQVNLDVQLHASKMADEILWLYYITIYILYKFKRSAEKLGLELHTFSASDHLRADQYLGDNIWTRTIRLSTTVKNTWCADDFLDFDDIEFDINAVNTTTNTEVDL